MYTVLFYIIGFLLFVGLLKLATKFHRLPITNKNLFQVSFFCSLLTCCVKMAESLISGIGAKLIILLIVCVLHGVILKTFLRNKETGESLSWKKAFHLVFSMGVIGLVIAFAIGVVLALLPLVFHLLQKK